MEGEPGTALLNHATTFSIWGMTMQLTSKYELGQRVFAIRSTEFRRIKTCITCEGTGKITLGDETFVCPKCGGSSAYPQRAGEKWYVEVESEIGKVSVDVYAERFADRCEKLVKVEYMLVATGVGGGTLWDEDRLFADRESAEIACEIRNGRNYKDDPEAIMLPQLVPGPWTDMENAE
jgi:hypothetical protein